MHMVIVGPVARPSGPIRASVIYGYAAVFVQPAAGNNIRPRRPVIIRAVPVRFRYNATCFRYNCKRPRRLFPFSNFPSPLGLGLQGLTLFDFMPVFYFHLPMACTLITQLIASAYVSGYNRYILTCVDDPSFVRATGSSGAVVTLDAYMFFGAVENRPDGQAKYGVMANAIAPSFSVIAVFTMTSPQHSATPPAHFR